MITKQVNLTEREFYQLHLSIINNFLPVKLSETEIVILAEFLRLPEIIRLKTQGRKIVRNNLNISHGVLGNHLRSLRDKGYIVRIENDEIIRPYLFPDSQEQSYAFKIINDDYKRIS